MNYLLRNIDPDVWARAKARADVDGITLRGLILLLVVAYAEGRIKLRAVRAGE